jgi:hypothetical protein
MSGQKPPSESFVVVPWAPAPLIAPTGEERAADGVDEFVDELFGADIDETPGWFDAFLFVAGTSLFVWSVLSGASAALTVVGAGAGLLGCVLPVRAAWRALRHRGVQRVRRAALTRGLPLVADHPATAALIEAYRQLSDAAALPAVKAVGEEAAHAGHQAMVEVATLLDGAPPSGPAEEEYVCSRTRALETLGLALQRQHEAAVAAEARDAAAVADAERRLDRAARLGATEELDDRLGPASLDRLALLARELEADHRGLAD